MPTLNQTTIPVNSAEADENRSTIRRAHSSEALLALVDLPIAFHRAFVKIGGGVTAGLMLSQAYYWSKNKTAKQRGGWFYKSQSDWEEETGLTRREQETARKHLRAKHLLEEKIGTLPGKSHNGDGRVLWFKVNTENLNDALEELIEPEGVIGESVSEMSTDRPHPTFPPDPPPPHPTNAPYPIPQMRPTTEITSPKTTKDTKNTHTQHLRAVGAPAVAVCSKFTIEECRKYAAHLHTTGQGIKNPGGYAHSVHSSGQADNEIQKFLNRTPEQVEEIRTTPENQNLFFGEAVQMLQAMMAVGREPQAIIDDMPLDDDTRRRLIEKFVKTQPHGSKAADNVRNAPGPELKPAEYKHEQLLNSPAVERHQAAG